VVVALAGITPAQVQAPEMADRVVALHRVAVEAHLELDMVIQVQHNKDIPVLVVLVGTVAVVAAQAG
jgi:hypothetical protein